MSQLFTWGGQGTGASGLASFLPKKSQGWSPSEWMVGSPWSPRDSQESSPTPQFKSINSSALSLLHSPTLTSIHDHWMFLYIFILRNDSLCVWNSNLTGYSIFYLATLLPGRKLRTHFNFFSSLGTTVLTTLWFQCLKTAVSYVLSSFLAVYCGRATLYQLLLLR